MCQEESPEVPEITKYLTFEAIENMEIGFSGNYIPQYSYDGITWAELTTDKIITLGVGNKLYMKGNLPTSTKAGSFTISGKFNLSGNCNSMIFGDNAESAYATNLTGYGHAFEQLFEGCPVVEISQTFLPAIMVPSYCYRYMFRNCIYLKNTPDLPADIVDSYGYSYMFYGCSSLTEASDLPAVTASGYCYEYMFYGCSLLIAMPYIALTTLANHCCRCMFANCTSLYRVQSLKPKTLQPYCYYQMFQNCSNMYLMPTIEADVLANSCCIQMFENCTSLQAATLPATTLAPYCYQQMFKGCTSLRSIPILPATTLANYCYMGMFIGCTELINAPELPATTLANYCYYMMFYGCSKLNYIKALFTTLPATTLTQNWVYGVAPSGTFIKHIDATWNTIGVNGVPTNWVIQYDGVADLGDNYFIIEPIEDNFTFSLSVNNIEYSINSSAWTTLNAGESSIVTNAGDKIYLRANLTPTSSSGIGTFTFSGKCNLSGNCMSLLFGDEAADADNLDLTGYDYAFYKLFYNCTNINEVSDTFLPATTLASYCYYQMFQTCNRLTKVPNLPATTLSDYCYEYMFDGCTSLINPMETLPATTATTYCYGYMFKGCSNLKSMPIISATTMAGYSCAYMFQNCTSLQTLTILPATTATNRCYQYMFQNCTSIIDAEEILPATTLVSYCYGYMFDGCSNLKYPPKLPATTLANYCYQYMFRNCIALKHAPELPAKTLITGCYNYMFYGCSSLNYIKALFTTNASTIYTSNWVRGVASTGTFIQGSDATWTTTGNNGIPTGWNLVKEGYDVNYLTIEAIDNTVYVSFSNSIQSSKDAITWQSLNKGTVQTINKGEKLYYKGNLTPSTSEGIGSFTISGKCNLLGNCMSMLFGDNAASNLSLEGKDYAFMYLFKNCTGIINISPNLLPATTLSFSCYNEMFNGCTQLVNCPLLPATTLYGYCYANMFVRCMSLKQGTNIFPKEETYLAPWCCGYMFSECSSLTTAYTPMARMQDFNAPLNNNAFNTMYGNCTALTSIYAYFEPTETKVNNWAKNMFLNLGSTGEFGAFGQPPTGFIPNTWRFYLITNMGDSEDVGG